MNNVDEDMVTELDMFIANDWATYSGPFMSYARNMARKWKRGMWDAARAVDGAEYVAVAATKAYNREHGSGGHWYHLADKATRRALAAVIAEDVRAELAAGNDYA